MDQAYDFAKALHTGGVDGSFKPLVMLGGDHLTPIATLRAVTETLGIKGVCLIHFDAHMDTTDEYFGEKYTHGTTFKRAHDSNYFNKDCSISVGLRGGWSARDDADVHRSLGFDIITPDDYHDNGHAPSLQQIRNRVGDNPVYITVDIDVLDPAYAPGESNMKKQIKNQNLMHSLSKMVD